MRALASIRIAALAVVLATGACTASYTGAARPVTTPLDAGWLRAAATPIVVQRAETDCGLAALAMIAGRWGLAWTPAELARQAPPNKRGLRLALLRDVARGRGLDAFAIRGTRDDLAHELAAGRPVLIGVIKRYTGGNALSHYEVAIAYDPRTHRVITIDPASGAWLERSAVALDAEWRAANYATLVVLGPRTVAAQ